MGFASLGNFWDQIGPFYPVEVEEEEFEQVGAARASPATQSPQGFINVAVSLRERKAELPTSVVAFDRSSSDRTCLGNPANFSTDREGYFFELASRAKNPLTRRGFQSLAVQRSRRKAGKSSLRAECVGTVG